MFQLFKNLKAPKAPVTKDFNDAFKSIQKSKEELSVNVEDKEKSYLSLYNKGLNYLNLFSDNKNNNDDLSLLHQSAKYFTEAIEIKKNKAEPYFYLAYIFYLMKEMDFSVNYMKIVSCIDSEFPGLEMLREKINSSLLIKMQVHKINSEKVDLPKPETEKTSSVKRLNSAVRINRVCLT